MVKVNKLDKRLERGHREKGKRVVGGNILPISPSFGATRCCCSKEAQTSILGKAYPLKL